jgi:hypothetical protein
MELDVELKEDADGAGVEHFSRGAALGVDPGWLAAMADDLAVRAFGDGEASHV